MLSMSASARFFGIPELLEMTLLRVPTLRILVIQRVNKNFRDIINASGPLQQKLFFKAEPRSTNINRVEWNPFMRNLVTGWENDRLQETIWNDCGKIDMTDLRNIHPNASWLRMLVCQPPRPMVEIMRFNLIRSSHLGFLATVEMEENGEGCRMSDIHKYGWQDDDLLGDDCYVRVER